ncbi:hypothetical protein HDV02_001353 [Globomyces sp. JEL0801]|nr:hypothetical protein HDV02_001353 [Globomyces sp. JEL0801]
MKLSTVFLAIISIVNVTGVPIARKGLGRSTRPRPNRTPVVTKKSPPKVVTTTGGAKNAKKTPKKPKKQQSPKKGPKGKNAPKTGKSTDTNTPTGAGGAGTGIPTNGGSDVLTKVQQGTSIVTDIINAGSQVAIAADRIGQNNNQTPDIIPTDPSTIITENNQENTTSETEQTTNEESQDEPNAVGATEPEADKT